VSLESFLTTYHQLEGSAPFYFKKGTRSLPTAVRHLFSGVEIFSGQFIDAAGGQFALHHKHGLIVESSRASLRCLQKGLEQSSGIQLVAGTLWDVPERQAEIIFSVPSTDKGTARVEAEFMAARHALAEKGVLYFVMHKDQGAKRYEKFAASLFGELTVLDKENGWRLCRAVKTMSESSDIRRRLEFEVLGLKLQAEAGVYAAGKLDPGTAFLLQTYDVTTLANKKVLDIGCGYGLLSLKAALSGAAVTALDDDLLAVRSTHANAERYGLDIRSLHSDVNSELHENERFDAVLMNPPFHVGKQVILDVPKAFIAAAHHHLTLGGELVLVANKALGYEGLLEHFSFWETLATHQQFKVLRAIR
jgi:16S rRNA (guanine1207-N2)-methyltransferase